MSEIKACPFCDKTPINHYDKTCFCKTDGCPNYARFYDIATWQQRPIEDSLRKQLAEAMKVVNAGNLLIKEIMVRHDIERSEDFLCPLMRDLFDALKQFDDI